MKKIAFIHEAYPLGGAERVTSLVAGYLSGDFEIFLFVGQLNEEILGEQDRRDIRFLQLPDSDFQSEANAAYVAERIRELGIECLIIPVTPPKHLKYIREHVDCPIVFHHHSMPLWEVQNKLIVSEARVRRSGSWPKLLEWYLLRKPKEQLLGLYTRKYGRQYRFVYRNTDRFVVLCEEYARQIERLVGAGRTDSKVRVMTNPLVAPDAYDPDKRKEVLFVGRMTYADKRADRLLDIWARIEPEFPDWELKMVGDGTERELLEAQARRLGLSRVRFCGYAADPSEHYRTAAILCMTSTFEGWGLVLAEAQAAGVVPMAFGCSAGVREILGDDGSAGVVVPPFDMARYASELAALMRDGERRRTMQESMRRKIEAYSLARIGRRWVDLLEEIGSSSQNAR